MLKVVTLNTELGELFAVSFASTGLLLPVVHPSQDLAELAMGDYANMRVAAIDEKYTRSDEEGKALRPGKRSDLDKWERTDMVAIVESFAEVTRERDAVNRFLATLTPEQRAALEG